MNKAFEKIIEKLEELHERYINQYGAVGGNPMAFSVKECMEIVKQEAEKYNNAIIDGKYCFQSCACAEKCDKCSRLCNGDIDWYENIDNWTEEYNNGWILCSERMPEDDSICIVTVEYPNNETLVDYGWFDRKSVCWFVGMQEFRTSNILAWQPLPQPYKPKGEIDE